MGASRRHGLAASASNTTATTLSLSPSCIVWLSEAPANSWWLAFVCLFVCLFVLRLLFRCRLFGAGCFLGCLLICTLQIPSHCANLDVGSLVISRVLTSHCCRRGLHVPRPLPIEQKKQYVLLRMFAPSQSRCRLSGEKLVLKMEKGCHVKIFENWWGCIFHTQWVVKTSHARLKMLECPGSWTFTLQRLTTSMILFDLFVVGRIPCDNNYPASWVVVVFFFCFLFAREIFWLEAIEICLLANEESNKLTANRYLIVTIFLC